MNLQELSKNIRMNDELARDIEMLENLKTKAYSVSSPTLSGMPHGSGVSQKTELFAVEIADLETRIAYLKTEISLVRKSITEYCNGIDDLKTRNAFRFRFIHCLSWKEVADLMGPYYSETGVKTMVYSYINNSKDEIPK